MQDDMNAVFNMHSSHLLLLYCKLLFAEIRTLKIVYILLGTAVPEIDLEQQCLRAQLKSISAT